MTWNIKDEGERFVVQCTGDELIMTLPDELLNSNDTDIENAIEETYSKTGLFEFFILKKDMKEFKTQEAEP